jgi:hypothetical protein
MFSAVLILILLTEMIIYAAQVGVFEQRKSANELRQKQAFHAAEVGVQHAQELLLANVLDLASSWDKAGSWLSDTSIVDGGSGRWVACADVELNDLSHPCFGETLDGNFVEGSTSTGGTDEPDLRSFSYFYSEDGSNPTLLPILADAVLPDDSETVEVTALLCMLDLDRTAEQPVQGCLLKKDPAVDEIYFMVTLLARGRSECNVDGGGDLVDCQGEALIAQRVGSYGPLTDGGGPGVPLTSKSNVQPTGTIEIVPNPNGGGPGVPVSVWVDGDAAGVPICDEAPDGPAIDPSSNSWATCEMQEWYGVDIMPEDFTCPTAQCNCDPDEVQRLSHGNKPDGVRFDIVVDPAFPCELFKYVFKTDNYKDIKPDFTVIKSCSDLGPESRGLIWVDGSVDQCFVNATTVGSHTDPVFLVSAADELRIGGGATIFGVVYTTDAEGNAGRFDASVGGTVYGAVMVDGELEPNVGSNFAIVYNDQLIALATQRGSLGKIYGGWTDFHEDWRR